jgi:glycosyltransferase involved in cell wall biosynthesis
MKFSIITPTFNRAHTIERAIKSMQSQTYDNWEMIISDDGSTDNTEEILKPYLQNDKRVKYFKNEKNGGVGKARNFGIKNISENTNWIGFLDSDDIFVENALELMKNKIKEFPDVKHFSFSTKYEDERSACKIKHDNLLSNYEMVLGKDNDVSGEFNSLLHKDIIDDGFHFNESINGYEWIAWLSLAKKDFKHLYTTTTTRIYITSGESLLRTSSKSKKYYENSRVGLKIILDGFGDDLKKINRNRYALYLSWYGRGLIGSGYSKKGFLYTYKSFLINPFELRNIRNLLQLVANK